MSCPPSCFSRGSARPEPDERRAQALVPLENPQVARLVPAGLGADRGGDAGALVARPAGEIRNEVEGEREISERGSLALGPGLRPSDTELARDALRRRAAQRRGV